MIYCFDLDGVICETKGMNYAGSTPNLEMIEKVNLLCDQMNTVVIDTARNKAWYELTKNQLNKWGVKYHFLRVGEKIPADYYIDDRNLTIEKCLRK